MFVTRQEQEHHFFHSSPPDSVNKTRLNYIGGPVSIAVWWISGIWWIRALMPNCDARAYRSFVRISIVRSHRAKFQSRSTLVIVRGIEINWNTRVAELNLYRYERLKKLSTSNKKSWNYASLKGPIGWRVHANSITLFVPCFCFGVPFFTTLIEIHQTNKTESSSSHLIISQRARTVCWPG